MNLHVTAPESRILKGCIQLPSSKSESNRALIIQALSRGMSRVSNLSTAKDSQTLAGLLREMPEEMNVGHAGTAMRFLTAFLAFQSRDTVLTGSTRMQQRPIGPLVDALCKVGADIHYMREEGYPPLMVCGRNARFGDEQVDIPGGVSSQYISALLMIAPTLPSGLKVVLTGTIRSRPYIEMTLRIMEHFGVKSSWEGNEITVSNQFYLPGEYAVEADWSSASYWFCMAALSEEAEIELPGLRQNSWQGDSAIVELMAPLGVETEWTAEGIVVRKRKGQTLPTQLEWNFSPCPDLAQGVLATMSALGVKGIFTGLESLRIKETDRILALQNELGNWGGRLEEKEGETLSWELGGGFEKKLVSIPTYQDHRMALGFAPLSLALSGIQILESDVVVKSYPHYWEDLRSMGFKCEPVK